MPPSPLRVEGLTDADFNARAPIPIDEVPTAREIRVRQNTWMIVGGLVGAFWLLVEGVWVPFGLVLAFVIGLLVRETAKAARENFALPLYLVVSLVGCVVGLVVQLRGWL